MGRLSSGFLAARGECDAAEDALLEQRLAGVLAAATAAWPGVEGDPIEFIKYLSDRAGSTEGLDEVHSKDLYLAWACARGDQRALDHFETKYLRSVADFVASTGASRAAIDEVRQKVRTELLVGGPDRPPGIANYRGQGALGGWLRVVALRAARDLLRAGAKRAHLPLDERADVDLQAADPELDYLKSRYAPQVSEAFRATLAALSPEERNLLGHYYLDALPSDTIAKLYRVDASTIRRRLTRLRQKILDQTHLLLSEQLGLAGADADSLLALVASRIEVSVSQHLKR
jgi:RNA polymerase sigma-70 factor (ECF subfamily)